MPAAAVVAVTDEHVPQSALHDVPDFPAKATSRGPDIGYLHDMSMTEATTPPLGVDPALPMCGDLSA